VGAVARDDHRAVSPAFEDAIAIAEFKTAFGMLPAMASDARGLEKRKNVFVKGDA
jgi:hypothetical protein